MNTIKMYGIIDKVLKDDISRAVLEYDNTEGIVLVNGIVFGLYDKLTYLRDEYGILAFFNKDKIVFHYGGNKK